MVTEAGKAGSAATTTKSDPSPYGYTARMYYGIGTIVAVIVVVLLVLLLLGRV